MESRVQYICLIVNFPDAGKGKAFDIAAQRAQVGAEQLGHHVDAFIDEIDGGRSGGGFPVEGISGPNKVTDIGNVNADLETAVGQSTAVKSVVDVGAAGRIDGADGDVTEVNALGEILGTGE